jgi:D-glycero-alpha-D-manno-heptose-7-phosphate kinase
MWLRYRVRSSTCSGKMCGVEGAAAPLCSVHAAAPIRVCDIGGWTDTWFARHGKVFNVGVAPWVEVQMEVHARGALAHRVELERDGVERYGFELGSAPGRNPLLEATIAETGLPDDRCVAITLRAGAPAGSATGSSAAATVALIAALDALGPGRMTPGELASAAHHVEVDVLGWQSGVQDQLCAAHGGIGYIEMASYPHASRSLLRVPDRLWRELDRRLVLVFTGRPHVSSEIHDRVIASLAGEPGDAPQLEALRRAAEAARDAVGAADLAALGRAMMRNTEAQAQLHPDLVGPSAWSVIDVANAHGAVGWKVNGAGGEGGSISVLCGPDVRCPRRLRQALEAADPRYRVIPTRLSRRGVRVRRR